MEQSNRIRAGHKLFLVGIVFTVIVALGVASPKTFAKGETYVRPTMPRIGDLRVNPKPKWLTAKWIAEADVPFQKIDAEFQTFATFQGYKEGPKLAKLADVAIAAWKADCQNPEKLYKAAMAFSAASEHDPGYAERRKDDVRLDLDFGFAILKHPPKSYRFVRLAYRFGSGCGHFHDLGNLVKQLLKQRPGDRGVLASATEELWDELLVGKDRTSRPWMFTKEYEDFLFGQWEIARKSPTFRPWDELKIGGVWQCRAMRTRKPEDFDRVLEHINRAEKQVPKGYPADFEAMRKQLLRSKATYANP